ncbi:MAG: ribosome-associated translation inhibitor RaiA [Clostridiaceae bacterium]|nr:ribosome-associated translation inhibitor RaiA [Clostridiaceae bacterium]
MKFIITGRKIEITDALRDRVRKKIGKLEKYFGPETEAHVTLKVEKDRHIVEVTIYFDGIILRAEEVNHDMYASIDRIVDTLEGQIRKNKTRLEKRLKDDAFLMEKVSSEPINDNIEEETEFRIVRTKRFAIKPMSVEEAILQMNLLGHQFFVFFNADTEEVNVVYKRRDGNYGLIEPEF